MRKVTWASRPSGSTTPFYPANIPAYRSFGEPNEPPDTVRSSLISYEFKHNFDNNWAITNRFLAARATITKDDLTGDPFDSPDPITDTFVRNSTYQKLTGTNYSANLDLTGKFYVLGAKNDVLIGTDYFYSFYNYILGADGLFPINIYNPIYGSVPTSVFYNTAAKVWAGTADFRDFPLMRRGILASMRKIPSPSSTISMFCWAGVTIWRM